MIVNCNDCGTELEVAKSTYNANLRNNKPFRCKTCMSEYRTQLMINRMKNMSKEDKKIMYQKAGNSHSKTLSKLSKEEKQKRMDNINKGRKIYFENQTQEEKDRISKIHSESNKRRWSDPVLREKQIQSQKKAWEIKSIKEKQLHSKMIKDRWIKLSDEEYDIITSNMSESKKDWWKYLDKEKFSDISNKISKSLIKYYNSISDQEREIISEKHKRYWNSLSDDDKELHAEISRNNMLIVWAKRDKETKDRILNALHDGNKQYWKNLTDEERLILSINSSINSKRYWESLSKEQQQIEIQKRINTIKSMSKEKREEIIMNQSIGRVLSAIETKTELEFKNILNIEKINYEFQWLNKIKHPEFDKLFPNNPITGSDIVFYSHPWDFKLNLIDKEILVDVDGKIHNPKYNNGNIKLNNNICNLSDQINFIDNKRIYQTDGLDAYIIKCYNNKIDNNTLVENIKTKEIMNFKQFISLISFMNMNKDDKRKMIKNIR